MSDEIIYVTYNFDPGFQDKYQGIYYAHIFGSSFAIGAKFTHIKKDSNGHITSAKMNYKSMTMGGTINFAIQKIEDSIIRDPGEPIHELNIYLNMANQIDSPISPVEIKFDKPFDPTSHFLRIQIPDEHIVNLRDGMINVCTKEIDDDRACFIKFG